MVNPKVSVVTPAYNCASTISCSIESVVSQSFDDWEMIIVDDGSSDDTCDVVEKYLDKDKRIKLHRFSKNKGAGPARNYAINKARGKYLAFLDSDDIWHPDKLLYQIEFMQRERVSFSYHDYQIVDTEGVYIKKVECPSSFDFFSYIKNTSIGVLTIVLDITVTGKPVMMDQPSTEAVVGWLKILKSGVVAKKSPGCLASYRISPGSVSRNKFKSAYWYWRSLVYGMGIGGCKAMVIVSIAGFNSLKKNSRLFKSE